jgi:DNA repair exonuclease SbcCD ATPase subunit
MLLSVCALCMCSLSAVFFFHLIHRLKSLEKIGLDIPVFLKGMDQILEKISQNITKLQNHARATQKKMNEKMPEIEEKIEELSILLERSQRSIEHLDALIVKTQTIEKTLHYTPNQSKMTSLQKTPLDDLFAPEEPILPREAEKGFSKKVISFLKGSR